MIFIPKICKIISIWYVNFTFWIQLQVFDTGLQLLIILLLYICRCFLNIIKQKYHEAYNLYYRIINKS